MNHQQSVKGYELYERIGSGGFGVVHRAYQSTVGREVAIKIILPHYANQPEFIRRFETEAQLVARLEHMNIVPLYDYWRDPDGAYLVMRWLRGGNLKVMLQDGPLDLAQIVKLLDQLASALSAAHRNGVIHRDIKPSNILLDEDGNAYLSDFGIAKDLSKFSSNTGTDMVVGSPGYLSPEQARSEPVSPRTDVYSLGVMLYEMLSGEHPFPDANPVERIYKHLNEPLPPLPPLDQLDADLRDILNDVIQKATEKNPLHRYADALELAMAFREQALQQDFTPPDSIVESLTRREQEILQLIIEGKSNREIAQTLFVTVGTVKWYINQIYKKLRVRNRVQAVVRARELNLVFGEAAEVDESVSQMTFVTLPEPENPYKGLQAFQVADARDFFGREKITEKLVTRLQDKDKLSRFLAVVGPSGSGKSSLVKAGLIPALLRGDLPSSDRWFIIEMMPGARPLDELEIALTRVAADQEVNLNEHLTRDANGLLRVASLILPDDGSELVVIIDQFEEIFTLVEDEGRRTQFLDLIHAAVTDPRSRVRIVVTLRADFYDRPLHYPAFGELVRNRMETVLPLSADELERAIGKPAAHVGVKFEDGLVSSIIDEVLYQPGALPLLQYALTELFERHEERLLTHEAYQTIGGTVGALAKRADELYQEYDDAGQSLIRQMFLRLVTLGEGTEDTRRRVHRSELLDIADDNDLMDDAIDSFASYRLLALDHDPVTREPTVEVAHEALLRQWERLRSWLNESRDDIKQQRQLATLTAEWHTHAQDTSYLVHGTRLEQFQLWVANTELSLTPRERDFLAASIAAEAKRTAQEQAQIKRETRLRQQRQRVLQGLIAVLLAGVLLSGGFGLYALDQRDFALNQRNNAVEALDEAQRGRLAFAANSVLQTEDVDLALALAMESVGDHAAELLPETEKVVERLAGTEGPRLLLDNICDNVTLSESLEHGLGVSCDKESWTVLDMVANTVLVTGPVSPAYQGGARFSPDGEFFLFPAPWPEEWPAESLPFEVWKANDLSLVSRIELDAPILDFRLSADSSMIVTIDILPENITVMRDQGIEIGDSVSLWSVETGELVRRLEIDASYYHDLAVSHDGRMGAVGGWSSFDDDKQYQITVFDLETGATRYQFERPALYHPDTDPFGTLGLSFSPDDQIIWFTGYPGYAIDLATGENYGHLHDLNLPFAGWSGTSSVEGENYGYLHDLVLEGRPLIPSWEFIADPDPARLLWFNPLPGEPDRFPNFVSFFPTAATDKLIAQFIGRSDLYVWDLEGRGDAAATLSAGPKNFVYAEFSPDGQYIGTVTGLFSAVDQTVTVIYDAGTFEEVYRLDADTNIPHDLAWSPDSRSFATVTDSEGVILWDVQTGQEIRRYVGDEPMPFSQVEFTPDGRYIVSGRHSRYYSSEGTPNLLVWDAQSGALIKRIDLPSNVSPNLGAHWLTMHPTQNVVYVTVNENVLTGAPLAGVDPDGMRSYLVNLDTGAIEEIEKDFLPYAAEFTPDGSQLILSAFGDNYIRIFDVETRTLIRKWQSNQAGLAGIAISPDGRSLVTNSGLLDAEPVVNVWDIETGQRLRTYSDPTLQSFMLMAAFSPDGKRFVSVSWDGTARVWNFSRQTALEWINENRYVRDLSCPEREVYRVEPLCD